MTQDFSDRFGGVGRLFGRDALTHLSTAHVCVVGVGGVGSWTVEGLARSGIGAVTLIDLDDVCVTNVNRQVHALDGQVGRAKVEVLAERVRLINPSCQVTTVVDFFTKASAERMLAPAFDYVVDAIDSVSNKALLIAECQLLGRPVLTIGGTPVFPWADGTCRAMAEPDSNLKLDCATGFGTAAFVTGTFGLAAAGEVVRLIAETK